MNRNQQTMDDLINDPLMEYSKPDLIDLINHQAQELEVLRSRADQFEHLYFNIIHSTSWKLAWPIRAAFKVLSRFRRGVHQVPAKNKLPAISNALPSVDSSGHDTSLDQRLDCLRYFVTCNTQLRINLLISTRLELDQLSHLLKELALTAGRFRLALRVLTLDPKVTARFCQDNFTQLNLHDPIEFVLHNFGETASDRNTFRVDFGTSEIMIVLSEASASYAAKFACESNIIMAGPDESGWSAALVSLNQNLIDRCAA